MNVDEFAPNPTIEVLAAVIREYGVDPTWLLTGIYDGGSHRVAMEGTEEPETTVRNYIRGRSVRVSDAARESIRHDDQI